MFFDVSVVNAATYTWLVSACAYAITGTITFYVRRADTGASIAATGTFNCSLLASQNQAITLTANQSYDGPVYVSFTTSVSGAGAANFGIQQLEVNLPSNVSTPGQTYMYPTPDAGTILSKSQGVRVTSHSLLSTNTTAPINAQGRFVGAKLPMNWFDNKTFGDITWSAVAAFTRHYDGAIVDGGYSFLAPYGPQQSVFLDEEDDFVSVKSTPFPNIVHVYAGTSDEQTMKIRATWNYEGTSSSQLFENKSKTPDPAAYSHTVAACSNMDTDLPNFIHLGVIGAALAAFKVATLCYPYVESAVNWAVKFANDYRTGTEVNGAKAAAASKREQNTRGAAVAS